MSPQDYTRVGAIGRERDLKAGDRDAAPPMLEAPADAAGMPRSKDRSTAKVPQFSPRSQVRIAASPVDLHQPNATKSLVRQPIRNDDYTSRYTVGLHFVATGTFDTSNMLVTPVAMVMRVSGSSTVTGCQSTGQIGGVRNDQ
jgi:hypothetical protein